MKAHELFSAAIVGPDDGVDGLLVPTGTAFGEKVLKERDKRFIHKRSFRLAN